MRTTMCTVIAASIALAFVAADLKPSYGAACSGFTGTWCKRAIEDTVPQQYEVEFNADGGDQKCVVLLTSAPGTRGNMGKGTATGATGSSGKSRGTPNTPIQGSTPLTMSANDGLKNGCSPSQAIGSTGHCSQTDPTKSDYIPICP